MNSMVAILPSMTWLLPSSLLKRLRWHRTVAPPGGRPCAPRLSEMLRMRILMANLLPYWLYGRRGLVSACSARNAVATRDRKSVVEGEREHRVRGLLSTERWTHRRG